MPYAFTDPAAYFYRSGSLFLGLNPATGQEVGISTERHAITIAGARSGKGAALLIPNARRWPGSLFCADPKGENADATAAHRAAMGQVVGALDPYALTSVPADLRRSINPLALVDPSSPRARLDLESIADGFIRRFDPKHGQWDNAGTRIGAGLMAHVMASAPPELRNMATLRGLMLQPDNVLRDRIIPDMLESFAFGSLARAAAGSILRALDDSDSVEAGGFSRLKEETAWMDDDAMASVLSGPNPFPMDSLKAGTGSLYLVIPGDALEQRSGFLRLFTRAALMVMARSLTPANGPRCLFLLDEFFSLGRLDLLATAAGQMPGFGVTLWPFVQDSGQIPALYGQELAETFFANADAAVFFGNTDMPTLEAVSRRIGVLTRDEVAATVPLKSGSIHPHDEWRHQNRMAEYQHDMSRAGKPRLPPDAVATLVGKKDSDAVAKSAIVFAKGGDVLNLRLAPHFHDAEDEYYGAPIYGHGFVARQMPGKDRGFVKITLDDGRWSPASTREHLLSMAQEQERAYAEKNKGGFISRLTRSSELSQHKETAARYRGYVEQMKRDGLPLMVYVGNRRFVTVAEYRRGGV